MIFPRIGLALVLCGLLHGALAAQQPAPIHHCDSRRGGNAGRYVVLANGDCDWDIQRLPPTVIVIHHTAVSSRLSVMELSSEQRTRLYHGQESGHYVTVAGRRREVYWAYHDLIKPDGTLVPLLQLDQIGFQADDWAVNRQAIGIALAGNYLHRRPPAAMLASLDSAVQDLLTSHPTIKWVVGHDEVRPKYQGNASTYCPGPWFGAWLKAFEAKYGYPDLDKVPASFPDPPYPPPAKAVTAAPKR